ncbi:Susd and RagB outer membrane lipoprotein [Porphyromonas macacae]|uniref:Susd and RagB outer membrane lipoprotein n=1 Tax=Porphyromonas macacae TaxID=28115 RepID=A0A379E6Q2_9PORP|nr:RagB/SusD family nutrient uptake outer membrane protein [Porphyromonas macacae]SUB88012.1 Susd and RagB outer membrane lipoprotein [Porphyromonas macacae]
MKKQFYIAAFAVAFMGILFGCTDGFDEMNTNPYGVTPEHKKPYVLELGGFIPQMQKSIYFNRENNDWDFQIMQNLSSDVYSGYMTPPTPFAGDKNNITYFMMEGWNSYSFGAYNNGLMKPWTKIKEMTLDKNEFLEVYAVSLLLKVQGMQQSTDIYGPIIYSDYGKGGVSSKYDSQEEVYKTFLKEIDDAQKYIRDFQKSERKAARLLAEYDLIFGGDYDQWLKLANSLRLRIAIRLSKVDPALAKEQGEKAVKDPAGFLEKDMIMPTLTMKNPLNILAYAYDDARMSADMESIMVGLKDPRVSSYFDYATDEEVVKKHGPKHYQGIRQGTNMVNKDTRKNYSNLAEKRFSVSKVNSNDIVLMSVAEICFLRAEGALRGWAGMGGSAEKLYEQGVEASFSSLGIAGVADYLKDGTSKPKAYDDPANKEHDSEAVSKVTVKWNEADDKEVKLEKIITQKWIAMFPNGREAWSEFRRTGYPRLFPILVNNSAGTIDSKIMIRRLPFSKDEYRDNKAEVEKAVKMLKGADNGGTMLWWDTNAGAAAGASNF